MALCISNQVICNVAYSSYDSAPDKKGYRDNLGTIAIFHIVSAHTYIGHVARYIPIIGETLQRWGKRILSHWYFLCNQ